MRNLKYQNGYVEMCKIKDKLDKNNFNINRLFDHKLVVKKEVINLILSLKCFRTNKMFPTAYISMLSHL